MADDKYTFEQARIRLEEIAAEVRKKDTSLEKSLDLLEEGVRLANICTELVDHTDTSASVTVPRPEAPANAADTGENLSAEAAAAPAEADVSDPAEQADAAPADEPGEASDDDEADGFEDAESVAEDLSDPASAEAEE